MDGTMLDTEIIAFDATTYAGNEMGIEIKKEIVDIGNLRKPSLRPNFKRALKRSRRLKFVSAGFRGLPAIIPAFTPETPRMAN
jgi:beta-phosphoglucomutase-like phosphatase (HAD superfamily)